MCRKCYDANKRIGIGLNKNISGVPDYKIFKMPWDKKVI